MLIRVEGTLRRFPGLLPRVERVVPRPKAGCKGDFKVSDLEAYLAEDESIRCRGCRSRLGIASLLFGVRPVGLQVALERLLVTQHQELLSLVQREFTESFHREQSLGESHCPSVFTLELERLPAVLPSQLEAWWRDATDRPVPARLTLYCEQPGEWHPVKSYRIEPPGRRLVELAPHLKKLAVLFKAAGLLVAKPAMESMGALAEAGAERWAGGGEDEISGLEEARWAKRADRLSLFTLRRLLEEIAPRERDCWGGLVKVATKQFHYLWLCQEHAKPHLRAWAAE